MACPSTSVIGQRNPLVESIDQNVSSVLQLSAAEMSNQITQCLKLYVENRINGKNAFQLRMIDFLLYSLKKEDPNMANLQMASDCLDASCKIYAFRVDKVYSDLLKIVGAARGDKRNLETDDNDSDHNQQSKRCRRNRNVLAGVEELKGKLETYDPLSFVNSQIRDTQTSDMLFQAHYPQHVNQGMTLNIYKDVILDRIPLNRATTEQISILGIDDFTHNRICSSYSAFKFIERLKVVEQDDTTSFTKDDSEFHFNLDGQVDDVLENESTIEPSKNIKDFQDTISNADPNVAYEYSYLKDRAVRWFGPSYWKVIIQKDYVVEKYKHAPKKKPKNIELFYTIGSKEAIESQFQKSNSTRLLPSTAVLQWLEDKITDLGDVGATTTVHSDFERFQTYLIKTDKFSDKETSITAVNCILKENFEEMNGEESTQENQPNYLHGEFKNQKVFSDNNLVSTPVRLTEKIFIANSPKRIDMEKLKEATWESLEKTEDHQSSEQNMESKTLRTVYSELFKTLPNIDMKSISPALAFMSLLHVANEKSLTLENVTDLSDVLIKVFDK